MKLFLKIAALAALSLLSISKANCMEATLSSYQAPLSHYPEILRQMIEFRGKTMSTLQESADNKERICPYCNAQCLTTRHLVNHLSSQHIKLSLPCPYLHIGCDKKLQGTLSLNMHILKNHFEATTSNQALDQKSAQQAYLGFMFALEQEIAKETQG